MLGGLIRRAVTGRCARCLAPVRIKGGRVHVPHLSWCGYASHAPARVTLLEPTPYVEPISSDDDEDQA